MTKNLINDLTTVIETQNYELQKCNSKNNDNIENFYENEHKCCCCCKNKKREYTRESEQELETFNENHLVRYVVALVLVSAVGAGGYYFYKKKYN